MNKILIVDKKQEEALLTINPMNGLGHEVMDLLSDGYSINGSFLKHHPDLIYAYVILGLKIYEVELAKALQEILDVLAIFSANAVDNIIYQNVASSNPLD